MLQWAREVPSTYGEGIGQDPASSHREGRA
jgi:hypothetical protein